MILFILYSKRIGIGEFMGKIKVIADSTCDLTDELLEKYDISIIPLTIILGENEYKDGIDITPNDIFKWSEETNTTPKTAAPIMEHVISILEPFVKEDRDIIFFGISEEMSSTCNVIRLAKGYLDYNKIHVVNSKNLSTGIGHLIVKAASMAKAGGSVSEILNFIDSMIEKVRASFVIDTLTYLHRGGRCSSVTALIGNTFKLKPMIQVNNGKMEVNKKFRGTNKKVLLHYFNDLVDSLSIADKERVFITHSGCDREIVDELKAMLKELNHFDEIIETVAGSVISSHCGPKTLGILYVEV